MPSAAQENTIPEDDGGGKRGQATTARDPELGGPDHSHIVHAGDACSHDRAANERAPPPEVPAAEAGRTNEVSRHRGDKRRGRQYGVVSRGHARLIGEQRRGDEMGRPDPVSNRSAGDHDPDQARSRL